MLSPSPSTCLFQVPVLVKCPVSYLFQPWGVGLFAVVFFPTKGTPVRSSHWSRQGPFSDVWTIVYPSLPPFTSLATHFSSFFKPLIRLFFLPVHSSPPFTLRVFFCNWNPTLSVHFFFFCALCGTSPLQALFPAFCFGKWLLSSTRQRGPDHSFFPFPRFRGQPPFSLAKATQELPSLSKKSPLESAPRQPPERPHFGQRLFRPLELPPQSVSLFSRTDTL